MGDESQRSNRGVRPRLSSARRTARRGILDSLMEGRRSEWLRCYSRNRELFERGLTKTTQGGSIRIHHTKPSARRFHQNSCTCSVWSRFCLALWRVVTSEKSSHSCDLPRRQQFAKLSTSQRVVFSKRRHAASQFYENSSGNRQR